VTDKIALYVERDAELQRQLDRDAEIAKIMEDANDPYGSLPLPIRMRYTRQEFLWLSDADKATLIQRECDPEF
jgi:hypothetical protein